MTSDSKMDSLLTPQMTINEARQCVDEINRDITSLRQKVYDFWKREGWRALGYDTWTDCVENEFPQSRRHIFRELSAAKIETNLVTRGSLGEIPERHLRPLTSLSPELQREVWQEAVETAPNGKVTAAHVQSLVDEKTGKVTRGPIGNYTELGHGVKQCETCGKLWAADLDYCPYCNISPAARQLYLQRQQEKTRAHVSYNSGENEWYTPAEIIEAARVVLGEIELDPASSDIANQIVKAAKYYTAEDDGLQHEWSGRVWMNPPYSRDLIEKFCAKLANDYLCGNVLEAIVLVNNATETTWFQLLSANTQAVCFPRGRVKFIDLAGNPSGAPLQGQAILYFGKNVDKFADEFTQFGKVFYA